MNIQTSKDTKKTSSKQETEAKLWAIADELRGKMDANEFKNYILGLIFFKFASEKIEDYANKELSADNTTIQDLTLKYINGKAEEQAEIQEDYFNPLRDDLISAIGYHIPFHLTFSQLLKKTKGSENILADLTNALRGLTTSTIGHESNESVDGLFNDIDLTSTKLGKDEKVKNDLISSIIIKLSDIHYIHDENERDVLGDAYEYLIGKFASSAGKKAGEFYTPQEISILLSKIVSHGKTKLKSVYDPTCGSGSLLLRVAKEIEVAKFYGQEENTTTYNLARMNMLLHGVKYNKFDIKNDDTLENPQHMDMVSTSPQQEFSAVVANPPFSANWKAGDRFLTDDRFANYGGKLAPKTKADYAFIQHMIYHLADDGTMAVVVPHGVLFRGSSEGVIRKTLVENNTLDCVIGLPSNLFYGTSIPACILVFKKCKETDDILFIDASKEFEKAKNQNTLSDIHINKIFDTYKNRSEIEKYSHKATQEQLIENEYNLNIPRYVDTFEDDNEEIDLQELAKEMQEVNAEIAQLDMEIAKFCQELEIPTPF